MPSKRSGRNTPVALVTGAGVRLGRAIAVALSREGYRVAVHFRSSRSGADLVVKEIRASGGTATAFRADIRTAAGARSVVTAAVRRFGRIDVLVNSAGVFRAATALTATERIWDEALDTNLKGMFFCSQAAARVMLRSRRGGSIINIASVGGLQAWSGYLPYSVSKAGVVMLTRLLARGLAPSIRVNAVAPGTIILENEPRGRRHIPLRRIPLRRYGGARDITSLVVFLATQAGYITGQVFAADGGRSIP